MLLRRRHRLITVLVALFSLLFMQLAVAGYACPVESKVVEAAAMAEAGMPCAGETAMDTEQPGLCHAHCQSAQQTVEKVQAATPMGAVATGFAYTVEPPNRPSAPRPPAQTPSLLRSSAPPISVRNCCFRI